MLAQMTVNTRSESNSWNTHGPTVHIQINVCINFLSRNIATYLIE